MSWMKSFFGKSSNIAQKVKGNKFVPSLGGQLEDRKLLATVTASAGSYTVIVSEINNRKVKSDGNIVATLKFNSTTIKSNIPVAISDLKYESSPSVAINVSGQFVVAYHAKDNGFVKHFPGIQLKVFNNKGIATYIDDQVAKSSPDSVTNPVVGINSKGNAILAYASTNEKGSNVQAVQYNYTTSGIFSSYTKKNVTVVSMPWIVIPTSVGITPSGKWAMVYTFQAKSTDVDVYAYVSTGTTYTVANTLEQERNGIVNFFTDERLAVSYISGKESLWKIKSLKL